MQCQFIPFKLYRFSSIFILLYFFLVRLGLGLFITNNNSNNPHVNGFEVNLTYFIFYDYGGYCCFSPKLCLRMAVWRVFVLVSLKMHQYHYRNIISHIQCINKHTFT